MAPWHGLLVTSRNPSGNRDAISISYAAVFRAPFEPWAALVVVIVISIRAL